MLLPPIAIVSGRRLRRRRCGRIASIGARRAERLRSLGLQLSLLPERYRERVAFGNRRTVDRDRSGAIGRPDIEHCTQRFEALIAEIVLSLFGRLCGDPMGLFLSLGLL